jgi:hypothetical protein
MASPRFARHAGVCHDGRHPTSRQRRDTPKKTAQDCKHIPSILIRWSIQEIRRIAIRLAQQQIQPDFVIAWSNWRRAHQAEARRAHLAQKLQL